MNPWITGHLIASFIRSNFLQLVVYPKFSKSITRRISTKIHRHPGLVLPTKNILNISFTNLSRMSSMDSTLPHLEVRETVGESTDGEVRISSSEEKVIEKIDSEVGAAISEGFSRIKKRKMVLMLSYCGQGYYGMQKNPDTMTIEGEFFNAMLKHGYIDKDGYNRPQTFGFQRAARTDKNVSAARQIVSFKGPENLDIIKLNESLPSCIRIMGMKRVTRGFDSKLNCDARTYSYMLPTFAFAPMEVNVNESYRLTPEVLGEVRKLFQTYVGTKNFHNFTSKKRFNDPSAQRHILSFTCDEPFIKDGLEYVVLRVKGQSFMLHQIRKMIGLCIAILRGFSNEMVFEKAFGRERIDIPKAPGLGLMLEEVHYHRYDTRFGSDGVHDPITWDEVKPHVEKFCDEFIYPIVTKTENEEKSMWNWLATLVFHAYDVREHEEIFGIGKSNIRKAYELAVSEGGIDPKVNEAEDVEADGEDDEAGVPNSKRKKILD